MTGEKRKDTRPRLANTRRCRGYEIEYQKQLSLSRLKGMTGETKGIKK